jgi:hypothetical protein
LKIKTKLVGCHTADSKPVKQEVKSTVILPPLVFPGGRFVKILTSPNFVFAKILTLPNFVFAKILTSPNFVLAKLTVAKSKFVELFLGFFILVKSDFI